MVGQLGEPASDSLVADWMVEHLVCGDVPLDGVRKLRENNPGVFESLYKAITGTVKDASGEKWAEVEQHYRTNLKYGVWLLINRPKLAKRSCDSCLEYWYSESGKTIDTILLDSNGKPRPRDGPTPCMVTDPGSPGCLKGHWSSPRHLNRCNEWAFRYHLQCKAVGKWPNDQIVLESATIIEDVLRLKK
jgi:hypothetical protein